MDYFGKKTSIGRLDIDTSTQNAASPSLLARLDRIADNYTRLDRVLQDLELKIMQNDYLGSRQEQSVQQTETELQPESTNDSRHRHLPGKPR